MFVKLRACSPSSDYNNLANYEDVFIRKSEITTITDVTPVMCRINLDHCKQTYYVYMGSDKLAALLTPATAPATHIYEGASL